MMNLIDSNLSYLLLDKSNSFLEEICKEFVCDKFYSPEKEKYTIKFLCGGFLNMLVEWVLSDFKEDEEYMAELFCEYCKWRVNKKTLKMDYLRYSGPSILSVL